MRHPPSQLQQKKLQLPRPQHNPEVPSMHSHSIPLGQHSAFDWLITAASASKPINSKIVVFDENIFFNHVCYIYIQQEIEISVSSLLTKVKLMHSLCHLRTFIWICDDWNQEMLNIPMCHFLFVFLLNIGAINKI